MGYQYTTIIIFLIVWRKDLAWVSLVGINEGTNKILSVTVVKSKFSIRVTQSNT